MAALPRQDVAKTADSLLALSRESTSENKDTNASSTNANTKLSLARRELLLATLEILANQSTDILHISKVLIRNLIEDLNALPKRTSEIDMYAKRFDKALKNIESIDFDAQPAQLEEIFSSVDEIGEIFYDIELMPDGRDRYILEKAFKRIGVENINRKYDEEMAHTISELTKVFDNFKKSLTERERQEEYQLMYWFERFHQEDDSEEKLRNLIDDFLDLFD